MRSSSFAKAIASIVTIAPPRRGKGVEFISPVRVEAAHKDDSQAIYGDFCAVGNDIRAAIEQHAQTTPR